MPSFSRTFERDPKWKILLSQLKEVGAFEVEDRRLFRELKVVYHIISPLDIDFVLLSANKSMQRFCNWFLFIGLRVGLFTI